jgi:hypothetical protein
MQHLDVRFHWLREHLVNPKLLRLVYCPIDDQVADCLTATRRFHGAISGYGPFARPPLGLALEEEEELQRQGDLDLARSLRTPDAVDFIHSRRSRNPAEY